VSQIVILILSKKFNHSMNFDAWGPRYNFCIGHVCHGGDLPFFFVRFNHHSSLYCFLCWFHFTTVQHANKPPVFVMTSEEERMSHQFIQWLTNFVHTGNPNEGPNKPQLAWPAYDMQSRKVMTVTLNSFSQAFPRGDKYVFSQRESSPCPRWHWFETKDIFTNL